LDPSARPIASRISGNAGSTVSIPSAVIAMLIAITNVNRFVPGRNIRLADGARVASAAVVVLVTRPG
jgi:hypothetical protein